jgi:hypothetical protein
MAIRIYHAWADEARGVPFEFYRDEQRAEVVADVVAVIGAPDLATATAALSSASWDETDEWPAEAIARWMRAKHDVEQRRK